MLDPEQAHGFALQILQLSYRLGLSHFFPKVKSNPFTVMNLHFPNRVGLAAGLDKNADYVDALASLGFGFIEVGTVTPQPQLGNPKPRLFRLAEQEAIINRMGFNNKGAQYMAHRLQKTQYRGILGINIGKNKTTPIEHAIDDYLFCFRHLWPFASYITINISSPNTPGLRDLQQNDLLRALLRAMKQEQQITLEKHKKYIPLVVKISPDLSEQEVIELGHTFLKEKIDGVIATNTTIDREAVKQSRYAIENGGLSGKPLSQKSTKIIAQLHAILQNDIPIIASGGVMDQDSAQQKINAGACLLQVYSGLIYSGIKLINNLTQE